MKERNKVLLINTQFVELYVSGFTNRFLGLWSYFQKNEQKRTQIHWLTNRTLWNKHYKNVEPPENVTIISAKLKYFKYTSRLFYPFYIIYIFYKNKCSSVHLATSIVNSLYLIRLFNILKIPYCCTFASNSLEMASYKSEAQKKKWMKLFRIARNIDLLNPTNSINDYKGRKFISPTSFPYLTEINSIPENSFVKPDRHDRIVFCGSFIPQKNPMLALEGFRSFLLNYRSSSEKSELILIGKGELFPAVDKYRRDLNEIAGREAVKIVHETELVNILSTSKIFLSLQDYDNYPSQSIMEAMLFCNSVISINNGDTIKLVDPLLGNHLLTSKNPDKLAKTIEGMLIGWKLNEANRGHVLHNFSVKTFADYFLNIHKEIRYQN